VCKNCLLILGIELNQHFPFTDQAAFFDGKGSNYLIRCGGKRYTVTL
ncbi:hypothetical protein D030_0390B, partial [Vibrio parahaemolyticus AQ3810]